MRFEDEQLGNVLYSLQQGAVSVPYLLLQSYAVLDLSETETMLLLHLLAYQEKENKEFPTFEELQFRMSAPPETVIKALQRLLKENWIQIDEWFDEERGVQYEKYNLFPMYLKLAEYVVKRQDETSSGDYAEGKDGNPSASAVEHVEENLFSIFEQEFGRPLSPMELETISQWIDQDRYPEELIKMALKEAVFSGKVHFRYIDRILLEWSRNRIRTAEDAKEYVQRFRSR